jgi:hypothetical protein
MKDESPNAPIERSLQELLVKKHLYQSTKVDFGPAVEIRATALWAATGSGSRGASNLEELKSQLILNLLKFPWLLDRKNLGMKVGESGKQFIGFSLPPVKTYCANCKSTEAFNLVDEAENASHTLVCSPTQQVFSIPMQCQACKAGEIVFLVTRNSMKLTLAGRSEFEEVQVPSFVPKELRKFYSQAVIAYNSGHFLPALFLLRTVIEQQMRALTGKADLRGDELCDEYASKLEPGFKQIFPSFKSVYGSLSNALHRADENKELFDAELNRINSHFQGLDAFAKAKA